MKFTAFLTAALAVGVASVASAPATIEADPFTIFGGADLSVQNFYGAPIRPWQPGARPGWYYGQYPWLFPWLPCPRGPVCSVLPWFPWWIQCPKPPVPHWPPLPPPPKPPVGDGYTQTFKNLTGATQAGDYITFGLVDTVADCKAMCNSITDCKFGNTYNDVNGKNGSPQLTCSLYKSCHTASDATNTGGQTQPDGSVNYIRNSDGWCKK